MPTIIGFIIGMLSELVPVSFDEIFGTNLSKIITDESVANVMLAPFMWILKLLQMIIVK